MTGRTSSTALGQLMRRLRENEGVSQAEVARAVGFSRSHICNVEAGRDTPSWSVVAHYEDNFGGDGQCWSSFVELTSGQPQFRQRSTELAGRISYPLVGDETEFIGDVTIPDGAVMPPLTRFTKTWRIKNAGTVSWKGRRLAREGAAAGLGIPSSAAYTPLPDTEPGQIIDVSVLVTASSMESTPQVRWKMVDETGNFYFPDEWEGLMLIITVRNNAPLFNQAPMLPPLD